MAGVKVLHGLDKVLEGGAVVLTLKDQEILANGDINEGVFLLILILLEGRSLLFVVTLSSAFMILDVDMLENVEIGEQKRRNEAYKAAKKSTGIYDDK